MKRVYYTYNSPENSGHIDFKATADIEQISLKIRTNAIIIKVEML